MKAIITALLLVVSMPANANELSCEYLNTLCNFNDAPGCRFVKVKVTAEQAAKMELFYAKNCRAKVNIAPIINYLLSEA